MNATQSITGDSQAQDRTNLGGIIAETAIVSSIGGLGGYGVYWILRLADYSGVFGSVAKGIPPYKFVIIGAGASAAIVAAFWTSHIAHRLLGERATYENLSLTDDSSISDKLRHRVWKSIGKGEQFIASPAMQKINAILLGGVQWYAIYWMTRLVCKIGLVEGAKINPYTYIVFGMTMSGMVETAKLIYSFTIYLLGKREDFEVLVDPSNASRSDRLRHMGWKVVNQVEALQEKIDSIYSKVFHIRTAQEVIENDVPWQELSFMEKVRHLFPGEVHETVSQAVPYELSLSLLESYGHTILGGHAFAWMYALGFFTTLFQKIEMKDKEIELKEMQQEASELQNRVTCDLLESLYPAEFAAVDHQTDKEKILDETQQDDSQMEILTDTAQEKDILSLHPVKKVLTFDSEDYQYSSGDRYPLYQIATDLLPTLDDSNLDDEEEEPTEIDEKNLPDHFVFAYVG